MRYEWNLWKQIELDRLGDLRHVGKQNHGSNGAKLELVPTTEHHDEGRYPNPSHECHEGFFFSTAVQILLIVGAKSGKGKQRNKDHSSLLPCRQLLEFHVPILVYSV